MTQSNSFSILAQLFSVAGMIFVLANGQMASAENANNRIRQPDAVQESGELQADPAIKKILDTALDKHGFPGFVAAIAKSEQPIRVAAVGVRKFGDTTSLAVNDQLHLGSCTKAITATMIGRLVENGNISWETTVHEALPELAKRIHPSFREVTIDELLTHRGGLDANAKNWFLASGKKAAEARNLVMLDSLKKKSKITRGKYAYSNLGYALAGMMAAKTMDSTWESLIQKEIFDRLKLTSAGFGPPGTKNKVDQPWGHVVSDQKKFAPLQRDNAPALGPAGTIHMSIADWARFCLQHTESGDEKFLSKATREQLHTPPKDEKYAKGWSVTKRSWGKGIVLTHSGSNTMWMATVWVAPKTNSAYLAVTNAAPKDAGSALDSIIGQMIQLDLDGGADR